MTRTHHKPRPAPVPSHVRHIMSKHGLSEPTARVVAAMNYPGVPLYGW